MIEFKARQFLKGLLLVALCAAPSLSSHNAAAADQPLTPVRLGLIAISESLGAAVAQDQGYFKDEGLDVQISMFDSGALAIPVLQSGRLDITLSNTIATLQIAERGLDFKILAPAAVIRSAPPDTTFAVITRKGEIKTLKDLEGKRVAINVTKSITWLYAVAFMDKAGVDWNKVKFLELGISGQVDSLLNNQVDAILVNDPLRTIVMQTGKTEILGYPMVEMAPGADVTQYIAMSSWVKANPDVVAKFQRALKRGVDFIKANDAKAHDINQQFTKLNPALKDAVLLPQFGQVVNVPGMTRVMELMVKYKLLNGPVDISNLVLH